MRKVPTIALSITYKGVKFIDAANKVRTLTVLSYPETGSVWNKLPSRGIDWIMNYLPCLSDVFHVCISWDPFILIFKVVAQPSITLWLLLCFLFEFFVPPLLFLQNIIAEHEIRNISCAAQDPEDLCTFAYITKDLQTSHHYCHVFSTVDVVRKRSALIRSSQISPLCTVTLRPFDCV